VGAAENNAVWASRVFAELATATGAFMERARHDIR